MYPAWASVCGVCVCECVWGVGALRLPSALTTQRRILLEGGHSVQTTATAVQLLGCLSGGDPMMASGGMGESVQPDPIPNARGHKPHIKPRRRKQDDRSLPEERSGEEAVEASFLRVGWRKALCQ